MPGRVSFVADEAAEIDLGRRPVSPVWSLRHGGTAGRRPRWCWPPVAGRARSTGCPSRAGPRCDRSGASPSGCGAPDGAPTLRPDGARTGPRPELLPGAEIRRDGGGGRHGRGAGVRPRRAGGSAGRSPRRRPATDPGPRRVRTQRDHDRAAARVPRQCADRRSHRPGGPGGGHRPLPQRHPAGAGHRRRGGPPARRHGRCVPAVRCLRRLPPVEVRQLRGPSCAR